MSNAQTESGKLTFLQGSLFGVGPKAMSISGTASFFARLLPALPTEDATALTQAGPDTVRTTLAKRGMAFAQIYARLLVDFGHPVTPGSEFVLTKVDGAPTCQLYLSYWNKIGTSRVIQYLSRLPHDAMHAPDISKDIPEDLEATLKSSRQNGLNRTGLIINMWAQKINCFEIVPGTLCAGTGRHSRILQSTSTDQTSNTAVSLCRHKLNTESLLALHGLPTAEGVPIQSVQQAQDYAAQIGYPVVVKPLSEDRGAGVFSHLQDAAQVVRAVEAAQKVSEHLMIERHVVGVTHRMTIVNGTLIHARKRTPGGVIGDGISTLRSLVERKKEDPESQLWRRRLGRFPIELDDEALELLTALGKTPEDIPEDGTYVPLRRRDNVNSGGTSTRVPLEAIHPDNAKIAIRALHHLRLNIGGVDFISPDVSVPWHENGAVICEVNAVPQMSGLNTPEDHFRLFDLILPQDARHVPVHVLILPRDITVDDAKTLADAKGLSVVACPTGVLRDGTFRECNSLVDACKALSSDTDIDGFAVITSLEDLMANGFPLCYATSLKLIKKNEFERYELKAVHHTFAPLLPKAERQKPSPDIVHV